ncbi:hypothetical protein XCR1_1980002 [Xenorhabdus cabanillasii JM26]|uniref:Uncharacterized protein n=1 Tax=Xenorhabdus cabanillasii JM26 TaxID=1427517 RepID=W1J1F6_9GAMM|nr:hypothetical protein XCR1_1980002 [Xenorhabdus cabanillasii JM26]
MHDTYIQYIQNNMDETLKAINYRDSLSLRSPVVEEKLTGNDKGLSTNKNNKINKFIPFVQHVNQPSRKS